MSRFKNIVITLVNAISIGIILVAVLIMANVVFTPKGNTPKVFGYHVLRIVTGSMEPTYGKDSLILVKYRNPEEIEVGDVISFYSNDPTLEGAVNTHRVVEIERDGGRITFTTRGDANNADDLYRTDSRAVIGVVIGSSLILGKLSRLVSNPLIFVPFILLPLVIMIIRSLIQAIRSARTLAKEEEKAMISKALEEYREAERFRKELERRRKEDEELEKK